MTDSKLVDLELHIPDVMMRVPALTEAARVFSYDDDGKETLMDAPTPLDVQNAVNKRVYRAQEWGKNVFREPEKPDDPMEHLDEEDREVAMALSFAKTELAILGQFADALAEGQRMQVDYVPVLLPPEAEERALRGQRLLGRKAALRRAATTLKEASQRMLLSTQQDARYYAEVRELRKRWTMHMAGGTRFTPVLSVVCAANYGLPGQESHVVLGRSAASGSVEVRVPALLRPRLCFNGASAWPVCAPNPGGIAVGVEQVHALLMELQRAARSKALYGVLFGGIAAADVPFASVRDEGKVIVADMYVTAATTHSFSFSLEIPQIVESSLLEVFLYQLMAKLLHHYRLGLPLVFGQVNEFVLAFIEKSLLWALLFQCHDLYRKDASNAFYTLCKEHAGLSVVWGGTDFVEGSFGKIISNAFFRSRKGKRVVFSMIDAGTEFHLNGNSTRRWSIDEVMKSIINTIQTI